MNLQEIEEIERKNENPEGWRWEGLDAWLEFVEVSDEE